jgi:hypothetical protein
LRLVLPLPLGWLRFQFAPAASPSVLTGREPLGLRLAAPSPAEPLMHSMFQLNLASPAKPSMSILYPPALASSGIFQLNNFRLASAFALLVRPAIPLRLAPQVSPSVRAGGHPPVLTGCPLRQPCWLINFRLAPTVYSSSLPAPNSDALTGHQLKRQYRCPICGRKCKSQANLWISPGLVHCCDY